MHTHKYAYLFIQNSATVGVTLIIKLLFTFWRDASMPPCG